MKNKLFKQVLSLTLASTVIFSSLGLNSIAAKAANSAKDGWNIDIYMSASNLESAYYAGSEDLIEMMDAKNMPSNVQITVQTGGSTAWHYDSMIKKYYKNQLGMNDETIAKINPQNISNEYIQRWVIKYDNVIEQDGKQITYPSIVQISANEGVNDPKKAKELNVNPTSMGSASTLEDFIKETVTEYKHNVIVFWNHGGGTTGGVCYDDLNGRDRLYLDEIDAAMAANKATIPNGSYDMIGFDACLMGNFETVAITSKYAQYLTASMTLEGDDGWEYTDAVTTLGQAVKEGKAFSGKDFGKALIKPFAEHYTADKKNGYYYPDANLATYDLSYADTLIKDFDAMAKTMLHLCSDDTLKKNFLNAGYKSVSACSGYQMIGMYTFLNNTMQYAKSYVSKNASSKNVVVAENVANCNAFLEAANTLYNELFNKDFFIDYFTGVSEGIAYNDHALSFFLPDTKNAKGVGFAKTEYAKLGISDAYAYFTYIVARDVEANQNIPVTSNVSYNKTTGKYTLSVTSKNGDFIDFAQIDNYLRYNGRWIMVRNFDATLKNNQLSKAPTVSYMTFNGVPLSMSAYDSEYFYYSSLVNVNGKEVSLEYDFEGKNIVVQTSLKEGDVVIPYILEKNGSKTLAKAASYTVKSSDISNDGVVNLPLKYVQTSLSNMAYDYYLVDMLGEEHHNFFVHKDTLTFTNATAKLAKKTYLATGKKITPKVTVKTSTGKKLVKGKDYNVVYKNNLAAGKATVQIVGKGKYAASATKTLTFTIKSRK